MVILEATVNPEICQSRSRDGSLSYLLAPMALRIVRQASFLVALLRELDLVIHLYDRLQLIRNRLEFDGSGSLDRFESLQSLDSVPQILYLGSH